MAASHYYPVFLDLRGRRCIVIGGGFVAQRKVKTLLESGAAVTVISPTATRRLQDYARRGQIRYVPRRFRLCDLDRAWLVIAATDEQRVNQRVFRTASRLHVFTNIIDQTPLCSFIAPAIVKRGGVVLAISTGGGSPALAKQLRRELGRTIGKDYAQMLRLLASLRPAAKAILPGPRQRKQYFDRLVEGRVFDLVRRGQRVAARREALHVLKASAKRNGAQ